MIQLEERIKSGAARIVVVGLGYVGLPLALAFSGAGFHTVGIDSNPRRIDQIRSGITGLEDVSNDTLALELASGAFEALTGWENVGDADVAIVCVPTPLDECREPDLRAVEDALAAIAEHQRAGMLVVLESTVYPGATRELSEFWLRQEFELGEEVCVGFSPERVDPGSGLDPTAVPKIVAGLTPRCALLTKELYSVAFEEVVAVSSVETAEMVKLHENTFRLVNVALANEMGEICRGMGIDPYEVVRAAATKPFGFMPFYPGPGAGGHCIPVDPIYLAWKVRAAGGRARFVELAAEVNREMADRAVDRVILALNDQSLAVNGSRVLVYGLAYKRGIADTRESPARSVIELLMALGAQVEVMDPRVSEIEIHGNVFRSTTRGFAEFSVVVVMTDHAELDVAQLEQEAAAIVDMRGVCTPRSRMH